MTNNDLLNALKDVLDSNKYIGEYEDTLIDAEYIYRFIDEHREKQ